MEEEVVSEAELVVEAVMEGSVVGGAAGDGCSANGYDGRRVLRWARWYRTLLFARFVWELGLLIAENRGAR